MRYAAFTFRCCTGTLDVERFPSRRGFYPPVPTRITSAPRGDPPQSHQFLWISTCPMSDPRKQARNNEQPPTSALVRYSPTSRCLIPPQEIRKGVHVLDPELMSLLSVTPHLLNRPFFSQAKRDRTLSDALLDLPFLPLVRWQGHRGLASVS